MKIDLKNIFFLEVIVKFKCERFKKFNLFCIHQANVKTAEVRKISIVMNTIFEKVRQRIQGISNCVLATISYFIFQME